jgi:tetratricopeptide (TPR) repeat protein
MQQNNKDIHPLKKARLKLSYTQAMLADFAQVGEATIQRAENGKPLRPDTIQQLCNYFSEHYQRPVEPDELGLVYEETKAQSHHTPEQASLVLINHLLENQEFVVKLSQSVLQDFINAISNLSRLTESIPNRFSPGLPDLNEDTIVFFETMMVTQWNSYYTGGAERVVHGLNIFLKELEKLAQIAKGTMWRVQALRLLALGYQLQNCVLRDRLNFAQASIAYQKAFNIAQEIEDDELIASALARQGVALVQQAKSKQAALYLDNALNVIGTQDLPRLKGYTLQALSEANAQNHLEYESQLYLTQAEEIILSPEQEQSFIRFNPASTVAQKGVDAVFLGEYRHSIEFLDQSIKSYSPTGISGRARLTAMKAEAYFKLDELEASVASAKEALFLAQSAGSSKIIDRIKKLHVELQRSIWKDESSIVQLGALLYSASTKTE